MIRRSVLALSLAIAASPAFAVDAGRAAGTATIDGTPIPLAFAVQTRKENLFDEKKQDLVVVLTDKALGATKPDDEVELSLRARRGELVVLALRVDGGKLVNVTVSHSGLKGLVILPGAWFQYTPGKSAASMLSLANREFEGHSYAIDVEFVAGRYAAPRPAAPPPSPTGAAKPDGATPPAAAAAPVVDRKQATGLLIQALMQRDERHALDLIKLGVDPNGRDQTGIPVLNWAVMMCQPAVVQALVDAKADLKYQRAPGMTILTEAGACPDAARILRAAGAR